MSRKPSELVADMEERLRLARWALIATGYFKEHEIGDDIAPRITELASHYQGLVEDLRHVVRVTAQKL